MKPRTPGPDDALSAEADLRAALQHRDAELERRDELAMELEALLERAARLLAESRAQPKDSERSSADSATEQAP